MSDEPEDWEQLARRGTIAVAGALRKFATEQVSRLERYQKPPPFRVTLLTEEQYQSRLERQGGVCAICGEKPKNGRLAIDHIHGTSKVRGLLCSSCNTGLGHFKDDPERLASAIVYLKRKKAKRRGPKQTPPTERRTLGEVDSEGRNTITEKSEDQ